MRRVEVGIAKVSHQPKMPAFGLAMPIAILSRNASKGTRQEKAQVTSFVAKRLVRSPMVCQ